MAEANRKRNKAIAFTHWQNETERSTTLPPSGGYIADNRESWGLVSRTQERQELEDLRHDLELRDQRLREEAKAQEEKLNATARRREDEIKAELAKLEEKRKAITEHEKAAGARTAAQANADREAARREREKAEGERRRQQEQSDKIQAALPLVAIAFAAFMFLR